MAENAIDFSRVQRDTPEMREFNIKVGDTHFKVTAPNRERAIAKAMEYIEANPKKFKPATPEGEEQAAPAAQQGPPAPPEEPVSDDPNDPMNLPEVTSGGTGRRQDGTIIPQTQGTGMTGNPVTDSLRRFGQMVTNQYLRTEDALTRVGAAAPEMALTLATGAAGEVAGGIAGTGTAVLAGVSDRFDYNDAAEVTRWVSDALTFQPISDNAKGVLQEVAGPLMGLENYVDNLSANIAGENPLAATAIKTILLGGPELLGLKGAVNVRRFGEVVRKRGAQMENLAQHMGVDLTQKNMAESVVAAANNILPARRGEHATQLSEALIAARLKDKDALDASYAAARQSDAKIRTANVDSFAETLRGNLESRFDLRVRDMEVVNNALMDLENIRKTDIKTGRARDLPPHQTHVAMLDEIETVRRRLSKVRKDGGEVGAAAASTINQIDEFLTTQLNRDLIVGNSDDILKWKQARADNAAFMRRWDDNKIIKNLLDQEATPEQLHTWLLGASALGASKQAGSVLRRIKDVLGNDHPAIRGVRQDFLFEIAAPLLEQGATTTALKGFIRNYDRVIKRNPTLVKELGIERTELKALRDFAETASKLPPNTKLMSLGDVTTVLARFLVGHEIAKATIRVNLTKNLMNILVGTDRVSKRQILADVVGASTGKPIAVPGSGAYSQFAIAAGLTSLADTQEEIERDADIPSAYSTYLRKAAAALE